MARIWTGLNWNTNLHKKIVIELMFSRIENMIGKGENAAYQHFLLFPQFSPFPTMF